VKVTAYLVVRAKRNRYKESSWNDNPFAGQYAVDSMSVNRVLAKKPTKSSLSVNEIVVPVTLEVPVEWFMDMHPDRVVIDIPEPPEPEPVEIPATPTVQAVVRGRRASQAASVVKP
jgi:hypothetical protein